MARDWQAELWPTSFKGVPFWLRQVDREFGQRLQEDQFPEVDDPFVQQLGQAIRTDNVEAYLVGDTSDSDSLALDATLTSLGPGTLVLPDEGPVQGFFKTGRRAYHLDQQGFIGFTLTFVRGTAALAAGVTPDYLGQLAFVAAGGLADAALALAAQVVLS